MDIRSIVIDADKTVGKNPVLTDIKAAYAYNNGQRSSVIDGYRYEVAIPSHGFEKLVVKIPGEQQIREPENDYPIVVFDGLELTLGWTPNGYVVRATATGIRLADAKSKV